MFVGPAARQRHLFAVLFYLADHLYSLLFGCFVFPIALSCLGRWSAPLWQHENLELVLQLILDELYRIAGYNPVARTSSLAIYPDMTRQYRTRCQRSCLVKPRKPEPAIYPQTFFILVRH